MTGKKTGLLKRFVQDFYLVLILVFLYAPIATMAVLSFNSSKSRTQWVHGTVFQQYHHDGAL